MMTSVTSCIITICAPQVRLNRIYIHVCNTVSVEFRRLPGGHCTRTLKMPPLTTLLFLFIDGWKCMSSRNSPCPSRASKISPEGKCLNLTLDTLLYSVHSIDVCHNDVSRMSCISVFEHL